MAERSTRPSRATSGPQRATTRSRTSGSSYSEWTTWSVEIVAAPKRLSAAKASDLPAPMPPVRPTNGGAPPGTVVWGGAAGLGTLLVFGCGLVCDRGLFGRRLVARNLVRGGSELLDVDLIGRRLGRGCFFRGRFVHGRLSGRRLGEDVLGQAELRHVLEVAGVRRQRAAREDLVLDPLDRQRQATPLGVDLGDLDLDLIARLDDLARVLDVLLGELGDVHEALDAFEDLDERTERDHLGHGALELVADVVGVHHALPRVFLGLLETQRDPLAVAVDVEHLDLDGVADREDLRRVVDVAPRQLG